MKIEKFQGLISPDWMGVLRGFIESEACDKIYSFLKERVKAGHKVLPDSADTWRAFQCSPYRRTQVILVGQDPYSSVYEDKMVADGLCFSCSHTMQEQPSLKALLDGVEDDLYGGLNLNMSRYPDLKEWAESGILMINYSLTTELNHPGAHAGLWKPLWEHLLLKFNEEREHLVFILMGRDAQSLEPLIDGTKHHVLKTEHPAYAIKNHRKMQHEKVFSRTNDLLREHHRTFIDWGRELPF